MTPSRPHLDDLRTFARDVESLEETVGSCGSLLLAPALICAGVAAIALATFLLL